MNIYNCAPALVENISENIARAEDLYMDGSSMRQVDSICIGDRLQGAEGSILWVSFTC